MRALANSSCLGGVLGCALSLLTAPAIAQQPPPIAPPPIPLPPAPTAPPSAAPAPAQPAPAAPSPPPAQAPAAPLPPPPPAQPAPYAPSPAPPAPFAPPPPPPAPAAPLPPPPPIQAPLPPRPGQSPAVGPAQPLPPPAPLAPPAATAPASSPAPAAAATKDIWYRPTPLDENLPWNQHNPWGGWNDPQARGAFHLTLTTASHFFQSGLKGTGGEVGVRLGAPAIGLVVGKYLPDGRNVVGIDLFPNYGKILSDAFIPDVQVGLLLPSLGFRYIWGDKDMKAGAVHVGVLGVRCTIEDAVQIDARPIVGVWRGEKKVAISAGLSLDAGIAF